jgi:predicted transcriptional regulator
MRCSKTELKVLEQIAFGKDQVQTIAKALQRDESQIYRIIKKLNEKGFARLEKRKITPSELTHVRILLQELSQGKNIINHLSGCGMKLYTAMLKPKTIAEIVKETGIKKSTVFYKLKEALRNSFFSTAEKKYSFNEKIWPKTKEFLVELKKYEETTDRRIPPGSVIYYKTEKEIVFSTQVECDATVTGFSAYEQFGIKLFNVDYTYYLPKKKLKKQEIFLHSLYRAEKAGDARDLMLIAVFYLKHKKDLVEIKHKIVNNIKKVLKDERIKYYPTCAEIKDRADIYDIEL